MSDAIDLLCPKEGAQVSRTIGEYDFDRILHAAMDYRGDITLVLRSGESVLGYLFAVDPVCVDLFVKDSPEKRRVRIAEIDTLIFSGRDTAA